jgi:hypothetical protein
LNCSRKSAGSRPYHFIAVSAAALYDTVPSRTLRLPKCQRLHTLCGRRRGLKTVAICYTSQPASGTVPVTVPQSLHFLSLGRTEAPKLAQWAEENLPDGFAVFNWPIANGSGYARPTASNALTARSNVAPGSLPSR